MKAVGNKYADKKQMKKMANRRQKLGERQKKVLQDRKDNERNNINEVKRAEKEFE